jgi:fructose-1,6-bisphosphatase
MTITRFVLGEQRKFPTAHGDLSQLLTSIQSAVKVMQKSKKYFPHNFQFIFYLLVWVNETC